MAEPKRTHTVRIEKELKMEKFSDQSYQLDVFSSGLCLFRARNL